MASVSGPGKPKPRLQKSLSVEDVRSLLTKEGKPPRLSRDEIFQWLDLVESIESATDRQDLVTAVKRMVTRKTVSPAADATATNGKQAFPDWFAAQAQKHGLNPDVDDPRHFYDWRKAWVAGAEPDAHGRWPSKFRLAGHPDLIVDGVDTRTGKRASWKTMRESQNARQHIELGDTIQNLLSNLLGAH